MPPPTLGSYLRTHRKRSGLSQRELAEVLGLVTVDQVSLHEQSREIPLLLTAIGYEIVFQVPLSQLLPGLYESASHSVEARLEAFELRLQNSNAKGRAAAFIARKLEWLCARREGIAIDPQP